MIPTSLYSRLVMIITFSVLYIHYTHYILSHKSSYAEPIFRFNSNSDNTVINKFLEFRDNYLPGVRPFRRHHDSNNTVDHSLLEHENEFEELSSLNNRVVTVDINKSSNTTKQNYKLNKTDTDTHTQQNIPPHQNDKGNVTLSVVSNNSSLFTNIKFKKLKETITKHAKPHEMINPDKMSVRVARDHHYSPRQGTQITQLSLQNRTRLLSCDNQASCIIPALQLQKRVNIYLCQKPKDGGGVRFYFLVKQGLLHHPNVILLDQLNSTSIQTVDYILYLPGSSPWDKSECGGELTHNYSRYKMIVLEEFDGLEPLFSPYKTYDQMVQVYGKDLMYYFMYFKRSFAHRHSGTFIDFPLISKKLNNVRYRDVYPITYPIADDYISSKYNFHNHREIEILCTLRGSRNASSPMITRIRAQEWVTEYVHSRNISHAITEPVSAVSHTFIFSSFFVTDLCYCCLIYLYY